jgi:hypothetical protein
VTGASVGRDLVGDRVALDQVERVEALAQLAGLGGSQVDPSSLHRSLASRTQSRSGSLRPTTRSPALPTIPDTCYVAVHQDRAPDWGTYFRRAEAIARELGPASTG